jgi:hypothetical protein
MRDLNNWQLYHGSVEMGRDGLEPTLTHVGAHTSTTIDQALCAIQITYIVKPAYKEVGLKFLVR